MYYELPYLPMYYYLQTTGKKRCFRRPCKAPWDQQVTSGDAHSLRQKRETSLKHHCRAETCSRVIPIFASGLHYTRLQRKLYTCFATFLVHARRSRKRSCSDELVENLFRRCSWMNESQDFDRKIIWWYSLWPQTVGRNFAKLTTLCSVLRANTRDVIGAVETTQQSLRINIGHMFKERTFWNFLCITGWHISACIRSVIRETTPGDLVRLLWSCQPLPTLKTPHRCLSKQSYSSNEDVVSLIQDKKFDPV